jgi:hypothetical protein
VAATIPAFPHGGLRIPGDTGGRWLHDFWAYLTGPQLGIGTEPSNWGSESYSALDIGNMAFLDDTTYLQTLYNCYDDSTAGSYYRKTTGRAARLFYNVASGGLYFMQDPASSSSGTIPSLGLQWMIDANGHMAIGSAGAAGWGTSMPSLDIGTLFGTVEISNPGPVDIAYNAYHNGSQYYYKTTGYASLIRFDSGGSLLFYTGTTGTAGTGIPFGASARITTAGGFALPTASNWGTPADGSIDFGTSGGLTSYSNIQVELLNNLYYNGGWHYKNNGYGQIIKFDTTGGFVFYTAPSGTAGTIATATSRFYLTNVGNIGLPTAYPWGTAAWRALDIGTILGLAGTTASVNFTNNAYQVGSGWIYKSTGYAAIIQMRADLGGIYLYVATSGTSGTAAGFSNYLGITSAGLVKSIPTYNSTSASAANVFIDSGGTLHRSTSSARYKKNIQSLAAKRSDTLLHLRPVTYQSTCKDDDQNTEWLGLIAEEVANVEPTLVHWGASKYKTVDVEDGFQHIIPDTTAPLQPEGVMYDRLTVLLIQKVQEQEKRIAMLESKLP